MLTIMHVYTLEWTLLHMFEAIDTALRSLKNSSDGA